MDLNEARKIAVGLASVGEAETVWLESALGRVAAEPVAAERNVPGEFRSRWDGFAFAGGKSAGASPQNPVCLDIAREEVTAGAVPDGTGPPAGCFRIMTGAALPAATDTVVPFEEAEVLGGRLVLKSPVRPGQGAIPPGADAGAGEILLQEGCVLTASRLAVVAALGMDSIRVRRPPRVAILATGDELRPTGQPAEGPVTFCNDIHLLRDAVRCCGGEPVVLGIAPDDPDVIFSCIRPVEADLVVTTGGMGQGSRDFIREVWERLGVRVRFDSLNLRPGKGSALGTRDGRIFLGLAGNPWSALLVFEEIAAPAIRRMLGLRESARFHVEAGAAGALKKRTGHYRAFYGRLEMGGGAAKFVPEGPEQGRGRLAQFGEGLAYTVLGPDRDGVAAGDTVEVRVPDFSLAAWAVLGGA